MLICFFSFLFLFSFICTTKQKMYSSNIVMLFQYDFAYLQEQSSIAGQCIITNLNNSQYCGNPL